MDSALRPRDIQARIRSGESAEQVATAAGTSVEQIMPYAAPVLAERAHQAQTALRASVRRTTAPGGSGGGRTLGQCVEQFLADRALHDDDLAWDSWRRPDGRWVLTATFTSAGEQHTAELTHDVAGRYVVAENTEARELIGEAASAPAGGPAPLGHDAIELVREPEPEPQPEPDEDTVEVPAAREPAAPPEAEEPAEEQPALDLGPEATEPAPEPANEQAASRRKRKGRSSVPSWDEIMFGGEPSGPRE